MSLGKNLKAGLLFGFGFAAAILAIESLTGGRKVVVQETGPRKYHQYQQPPQQQQPQQPFQQLQQQQQSQQPPTSPKNP